MTLMHRGVVKPGHCERVAYVTRSLWTGGRQRVRVSETARCQVLCLMYNAFPCLVSSKTLRNLAFFFFRAHESMPPIIAVKMATAVGDGKPCMLPAENILGLLKMSTYSAKSRRAAIAFNRYPRWLPKVEQLCFDCVPDIFEASLARGDENLV